MNRKAKDLAITGGDITGIKLTKSAFVSSDPVVDMSPVKYTFEVVAVSKENISFILPIVSIIGPHPDDMDLLLKYSKFISNKITTPNKIVHNVFKCEIQCLTFSMTIQDISITAQDFIQELSRNVQSKLNPFGLFLYNADVKQMVLLLKKQPFPDPEPKQKKSEAEAQKRLADSRLYAKKKEAEGLKVLAKAQSLYLRTLLDALDGNYTALIAYLKTKGGYYEEFSKINAEILDYLKNNRV